jgi:hypothetical protein
MTNLFFPKLFLLSTYSTYCSMFKFMYISLCFYYISLIYFIFRIFLAISQVWTANASNIRKKWMKKMTFLLVSLIWGCIQEQTRNLEHVVLETWPQTCVRNVWKFYKKQTKSLPSIEWTTLGKDDCFAKYLDSGTRPSVEVNNTRQRWLLCRVPWLWHSTTLPSLYPLIVTVTFLWRVF